MINKEPQQDGLQTQEEIKEAIQQNTLQHFVSSFSVFHEGEIKIIEVLKMETLVNKFALVFEMRRDKLGLRDDEEDPEGTLYMAKVEKIMSEGEEVF